MRGRGARRNGGIGMEEEGVMFEQGGLFYNTHMRLCRSFSSLLVGSLGGELSFLDGFCASGIRGIRYAKENPNVSSLEFVDISEEAAELALKNARENGLENVHSQHAEFNSFMMEREYDFVEIDPFGSPAPYAYHAIRSFRGRKGGYLSISATDTAVLCGAHPHACKRVYHSRPLHDEILHECGIRILWKYVSNIANEFNFGIRPLASLSHRHFFKIFLELEKGSECALNSFGKTGYITFCHCCGHRQKGRYGLETCPKCGKRPGVCGPLWLGELHDLETIGKMRKLNSQRGYSDEGRLDSLLSLMEGEVGMPPWFFEVHASCRRLNIQPPPKIGRLIEKLQGEGFGAVRTHFTPLGLKTDADICGFGRALSDSRSPNKD
jgi:tRNA (guanine26-N2/guanine27-N2)-dimethyltransferase